MESGFSFKGKVTLGLAYDKFRSFEGLVPLCPFFYRDGFKKRRNVNTGL